MRPRALTSNYVGINLIGAAYIPEAIRMQREIGDAVYFLGGQVVAEGPNGLADGRTAHSLTGYPIGGMPCFVDALLIVDPKVLEREFVYTGGGSEYSIVKIPTSETLKLDPTIRRITGKKSNRLTI